MAYEMSYQVARYFSGYAISRSKLIEVATEALKRTAADWAEMFLPRHFTFEAHNAYGVMRRTKQWDTFKRLGRIPVGGFARAQMRSIGIRPTTWIQIAPQPIPLPFVATGDLKEQTYGRRTQLVAAAKVDKSGGATDLVLKMKMPFPHPVQSRDAGMLVKTTAEEKRRLKQRFHVHLRDILKERGFSKRKGAVFVAGYPVLDAA